MKFAGEQSGTRSGPVKSFSPEAKGTDSPARPPAGRSSSCPDITEHIGRSVLESSQDCIKILDLDARLLFLNPGARIVLECRDLTELLNAYWPDFWTGADRDACLAAINEAKSGRTGRFEGFSRTPKGTPKWWDVTVSPILDSRGKVERLLAVSREVTERKHAEQALARQAHEQSVLFEFTDKLHRATSLAQVYDSALDSILSALECTRASVLLFDEGGVMRFVGWRGLSEEYRRAVEGHSPWIPGEPDAQPLTIEDVDRGDMSDALRGTVKREGIRALAFIPLVTNGELIGKFMVYYDAPHVFTRGEIDLALTIARQLGFGIQQKRAAEELRHSEQAAQRLAAIVSSSEDAIISVDLAGLIASWNMGAERLFGYIAGEVIGRPITLLLPADRLAEESAIMASILQGRHIEHYETVRQRKDGSLVDVSLSVSPLTDRRGRVMGASKIARDITDKIRAVELLERTVAERTAQLRDMVAELEAFSYSLAHDMRAPLRSMQSYSRFLEEEFAPLLPDQAREYIRRIVSSTGRLDALITDVLNYSKVARGELKLEPVDAEMLTREIIDSYPDLRDSKATIVVEPSMPLVVANPAALTQCLSNLLSNAVKFVSPGTIPKVRVRGEPSGEMVRIWVEDNGIGISNEGQKKIFNMFQRLNRASEFEGTGIGLTIVRKAIERMGGRVGVESQPGAGSRFWFELKRAS